MHPSSFSVINFFLTACNGTIIYVAVQPPSNVRAMVLGPRSIQITWEPPLSNDDDDVTGYLISYTPAATYASNGNVTVNSDTTTLTLTNLEENTRYTITVQATTSDSRMSGITDEVSESVKTYTDGRQYI